MAKRSKPKAEQRAAREDELAEFEELCRLAKRKQDINREKREAVRDNPRLQEQVRAALIADLRRVYEDERNPYKGFAASRKRYRQLGEWPEIIVEDFFGQHAEFLRAAGLHDKRGTTRSRSRSAKLHSEQEIARYAKENVTRYHGKWDKAKGKRKHMEALICSDAHSHACDPFARHVFDRAVDLMQPDVIAFNGDVVDFPSVSTHPKLPGHFHMTLHDEIQWARDWFRRTREAAPNAAIYYVLGNHEHRLVRYLASTAPELACLPSLNWNQLFGLDEFEVSLVCRSTFLAPSSKHRKAELRQNWLTLGDCYVITHGTATTKHAAHKELESFRMSGTSGHTHRPQVFHDTSVGTGPMSWMSTPMMANRADGRDFIWGLPPWTMGFGMASVWPERKLVSQHLVPVYDDAAWFAGMMFEPTAAVRRERDAMMAVG